MGLRLFQTLDYNSKLNFPNILGVVLMLIVNMDPMARQVLANVMPIT